MQTSLISVAEIFKTLAEPTRLRIVQALTPVGKAVSLLVEETGIPQPLVSHHLRILKDRGIARSQRRGAFTYYGLVDEAVWKTVQACSELLEKMRTSDQEDTKWS